MARVPELGWTEDALSAGAKDAGFPGVTGGMAQGGGADLAMRHLALCDARLDRIMEEEVERIKDSGDRVRVRPFTRKMVEARLRMNAEHILSGRWAEAVALLARPDRFPAYLEQELKMIDSVWHFAGDLSSDMNWYTKRVSLAAMYKATEMCMMEDQSEDFKDTWAFLDRRFEDEVSVATFLMESKSARRMLNGVFTTAINVMGLPRK